MGEQKGMGRLGHLKSGLAAPKSQHRKRETLQDVLNSLGLRDWKSMWGVLPYGRAHTRRLAVCKPW